MMSQLDLERPPGLADRSWAAIDDCRRRLEYAIRQDWPLAVGSAKELVEATAKVVISARGATSPSEQEYDDALNEAHKALARQPGPGLSDDPYIRDIASSIQKMARNLRAPRNTYGTGHGRAVAPEIPEEVVRVMVDAAVVWCRWALRRLEHLIAGEPHGLARDLDNGVKFTRATIAARLMAANLPALGHAEQHLLGLAVAHRAMDNTFVVAEEGLEACADSRDLTKWPIGYRAGLVEGLFLNRAGEAHTTAYAVEYASRVLAPVTEGTVGVLLGLISEKISQAILSYHLAEPPNLTEVTETLTRAAHRIRNIDDRESWYGIGHRLHTAPTR